MTDLILPLDVERLANEWKNATPFPFVKIDPFLDANFARAVTDSYPSFAEAQALGHEFRFVNEQGKIQITDSKRFPEPVAKLNELLAAPEFLDAMVRITGIPKLLADDTLAGGGIHMTGPRGRLDVHVDFNFVESKGWHRRMNLLLYLNPRWDEAWGGGVELWDDKVKKRHHHFTPTMNRCVIFETSGRSYHGVAEVLCPADHVRKSFATYYYTQEAPAGWTGRKHSTIFRARPDEKFKGYVLMPAEKLAREVKSGVSRVARFAKRRISGK